VRAARAFWFLEYLGHPDVRLLDGGFKAWAAAGQAVSTEPQAPTQGQWHGTPRPELVASREYVGQQLGRPETTIVDTRSDAERYGEEVRARRWCDPRIRAPRVEEEPD
jgi:thiosulfate/3-mercaptopyruvate sulfurtransferase